jgi:sugar-specific transcriptional regulator TrmB
LSEQQKKVFNLARDLGEFKASQIFSQSGLQFSDLYDTLKSLEEKKLLMKQGENYVAMKVNIADFELQEEIRYEPFEYKKMEEKRYSLEDVKKMFVNPDDVEECFVVS